MVTNMVAEVVDA
jgi:hypothetical protein